MAKKDEIVADLKDLLETDNTRSKIGRIWEIYDEIVELQKKGVSMKNIEARLNGRGFALKPGNLSSYLYQIKKKMEAGKVTAPVEPTPRPARGTKPKPEKAAAKAGKGEIKSPATPDLMDGKKPETPAVGNESEEDLTDKQKRERKASQYLSNDETSSYISNFIKPKE